MNKLQPSRRKYKFEQKNLKKIFVKKTDSKLFDKSFAGLMSLEGKIVSSKVLNAMMIAIKRSLMSKSSKKTGDKELSSKSKIFMGCFPDKPISKKTSTSSRMGKGKSSSDIVFYATRVRPGTILFQIMNKKISEAKAIKALTTAKTKLGLKCLILIKQNDGSIKKIKI